MTTDNDELSLVRRLVENHHLSVVERRMLPRGGARFSLIVEAIGQVVAENGSFPASRSDDHVGEGVLVERNAGGYSVEVHREVGVSKYAVVSMEQFTTLESAAAHAIASLWGDDIDGVPIVFDGAVKVCFDS